ncbi:MAG: D-aminoacyl-tRNA deacylase [Pseudonocardia sp.]|nr:D-aminoacyl-tRNA deacylase [Pseudonocardia sp.]
MLAPGTAGRHVISQFTLYGGEFGAAMAGESVNDGPFTVLVDVPVT